VRNSRTTKNIQTLLEAPKSRERLEMALDELEKDYDYIIVDTPPSLNVLTDNALVATGNVVIPVIPEKLNANSLQIFAKKLSSLEQAYGDINRLAIVCNRVEQNAEHRDTIEEIKSAYSLPVFEIPKRTDLSQSIGRGCLSSASVRRTSASRMHATCSTRSPTYSTRRLRRPHLRR